MVKVKVKARVVGLGACWDFSELRIYESEAKSKEKLDKVSILVAKICLI